MFGRARSFIIRNVMTRNILFSITALVTLTCPTNASAGSPASNVERGRYLVESVAMCGQCHTPRDGGGDLLRSQWLRGGAVPITKPYAGKPWAEFAPRIAGLPQYSDAQALRLLTRGVSRTDKQLRPPMPPYRMSEQDAQEVIAYLKSLE